MTVEYFVRYPNGEEVTFAKRDCINPTKTKTWMDLEQAMNEGKLMTIAYKTCSSHV